MPARLSPLDLGPRYLERFSEEERTEHSAAISSLSPERPVHTIARGDERGLRCTVIAFDYPSEFSLITGVLSSMGFDITEGEAFTIGPTAGDGTRRKIIDSFAGSVRSELWSEEWAEALTARLERVVLLLEGGGKDSQARTKRAVAELAASTLEEIGPPERTMLFPVAIEVDSSGPGLARMRVESEDTPFFLFAFSAALSLQGVSIERVTIRTKGNRIEDIFEIADVSGGSLGDPERIGRIKLSVLLAKQFTAFLGGSSDPRAAFLRFEDLAAEVLALPDQERWLELLSRRSVMGDLARLLGASDFLWEDFIRLQYENLLPLLGVKSKGVEGAYSASFGSPVESLRPRLEATIHRVTASDGVASASASGIDAATDEAFAQGLNDFKDREIFLYDLDYIVKPGSDFRILSERLTALAELVVEAAVERAYRSLASRYGEPLTVAGLPVKYAVLGLGKMGGTALGYASDIELLFVYGDSGKTAGPSVIDNGEFFGALVRATQALIRAKREGIFHIDLRLRPYGDSGPLACSLESFCVYYASDGPAHSYERLALVRLRAIAGDKTLGERVERIRDELVYVTKGFDMGEFAALRERQLAEKTKGGRPNAKFGSGALVDLEYAVQILQVERGGDDPRLRTPSIHEAIAELAAVGAIDDDEAKILVADYGFFRTLINGLRMLRGSALDLYLPATGSEEYAHLARRIGFLPGNDLDPARRLHLEFEARTAEIRAFAERHFGASGPFALRPANAADLALSPGASEDERDSILSAKGFKNPARAFVNLRNISGLGDMSGDQDGSSIAVRRASFARLFILACDILSQKPDPDMALNNWERFISSLTDPAAHLDLMLSQPMRLEILLDLLSTSQFLADVLAREPTLLGYISDPRSLRRRKADQDFAVELSALSSAAEGRGEWMDSLRSYRRREILRIGARDICLGVKTALVMEELSSLACGIVDATLGRILEELRAERRSSVPRFCVVAFGKLGGRELNYSSDIDLLGLWEAPGDGREAEQIAAETMARLRSALSEHTSAGYAYRVDLRLRPYGSSGQLVSELGALVRYYSESAESWELQALLKARPVAGDLALGQSFLDSLRGKLLAPRDPAEVASSVDSLRSRAVRELSRGLGGGRDVKTGLGGIRDVEFLVQGLQLIHAHAHPALLVANTLDGLAALADAGILPHDVSSELADQYVFLRRVEHFLQIYEDRQTHRLPSSPEQELALARCMHGPKATIERFRSDLELRFEKVHEEYREFTEGAHWGNSR